MAATGKVLGTVTSVVGEVKATAADGTVRILQVGDKIHADETLNTGTLGSVNIVMENGATLDCGANTDLAMHEGMLGVAAAVAAAPSAVAPTGDVAALQAAIAAGQDPSQVAAATAAGGAPGAGGSEDGGAHGPVILEQTNSAGVVASGFATEGAGIGFPSPEFQLLNPIVPEPTVSVAVDVSVAPDTGEGGGGTDPGIIVSGNTASLIEGTNGAGGKLVTFVISLSEAFDQPVTVSYNVVPGTAQTPSDYFDGETLSGTVTLPPGATEFFVTVQITQDHLVEGNETFNIVLSDAINATIDPNADEVIVTIVDDDLQPIARDDAFNVNEGQTLVGNVLSKVDVGESDDDTAQGPETLQVITAGTFQTDMGGTVVLAADGRFTYTPPSENYNGPDSFQYTIREMSGVELINDPDSATVSINVVAVNDPPVAQGEAFTTQEDTALAGSVTGNESDVEDGTNLTYVLVSGPSNSEAFTLNADGSFSYMPSDNYNGPDSFTYRVVDSDGLPSNVVTANITVTPVNDPPVINAAEVKGAVYEAGLEGGSQAGEAPTSVGGTFTVSDVDGDTISLAQVQFSIDGGSTFVPVPVSGSSGSVDTGHGTLTLNSTDGGNTWTWNYVLNDNVDSDVIAGDQFKVSVTDGTATVSTEVFANVAIVDDLPQANDDVGGADEDSSVTVNVLANDSSGADVVGTVVSATLATANAGTVSFAANGDVIFTPASGFQGPATINYTMQDADGDPSSAKLVVTVSPDSEPTVDVVLAEGDDGASDESALSGGTGGGSTMTSGTFPIDTGNDSVASLTVDGVNVTNGGTVTTGDYGTLVVTLANGVYSWAYTLNENAPHTGTNQTGSADQFPEDVYNIVVTDSDGDSDPATLTVQINDDGPKAVDDATATAEDTAITVDVLANDAAGADAGKTLVSATLSTEGAGSVAIVSGQVKYTPTAGFEGPATINYTMRDAEGDTSSASLVVTVSPDSEPTVDVVLAEGDDGASDESALSGGTGGGSTMTSGTFPIDTGNDAVASLTVDGVNVTNGGTVTTGDYGTLVVTLANGVYSWTYTLNENAPHTGTNQTGSADQFPEDVYNIVVTDSDGDSDPATLTVQINDDGPVAVDDGRTTAEDTAIMVDVLANDAAGADAGKTLVSATLSTEGAGSVAIVSGQVKYTPAAGFEGPATINYTMRDAEGDTSTASLVVTVDEDSTPQVGTAGNLTVDEDGFGSAAVDTTTARTDEFDSTESLTQSGQVTVNFGNDVPSNLMSSIALLDTTGLDGQLQTLGGVNVVFALESGKLVGRPSSGGDPVMTIEITDATAGTGGNVTYTYMATLSQPVKHDAGSVENTDLLSGVTFQVTDKDTDSNTGTFSVTVYDDVPQANADAVLTVVETAGVTSGTVLLANDKQGADGAKVTDVSFDGGTNWTVVSASGTTVSNAKGTYTFQTDGTWTLDPNANLSNTSGIDASFTYRITDGDGDSSTATQTVTITDGMDPSVSGTVSLTVNEAALASGSNPSSPGETAQTGTGNQLTFTANADAITGVEFGSTAGINVTGAVFGTTFAWSVNTSGQLEGRVGGASGPIGIILTISGTTTASAGGGTATPTITATLTDDFPHAPGPGSISVTGIQVVAVDTDDDSSLAGTVSVSITDDAPLLAAPNAVMSNDVIGSTPSVLTAAVSVTYGADGGALSITGASEVNGVIKGTYVDNSNNTVTADLRYSGSTLHYVQTSPTQWDAVTNDVSNTTVYRINLDSANKTYSVTLFHELDPVLDIVHFRSGDAIGAGIASVRLYQDAPTGVSMRVTADTNNLASGGVGNTDQVNTTGEWFGTGAQSITADDVLKLQFAKNGSWDPSTYDPTAQFQAVELTGINFAALALNDGEHLQWTAYNALGNVITNATWTVLRYDSFTVDTVTKVVTGVGTPTVVSVTSNAQVTVDGETINTGWDIAGAGSTGSNEDLYLLTTNAPFAKIAFEAGTGTTLDIGYIDVATVKGSFDLTTTFEVTAKDGDLDVSKDTVSLTFSNDATLVGTPDNDVIQGSIGNDILTGGAGNDVLIGGDGSDTFKFTTSADGQDSITLFTIGFPASGGDVLNVHDVFASNPTVASAVATAVGADDATALSQYLHLEVTGTVATLFADVDGTGGAGHQALAMFSVTSGTTAANLLQTLLDNNQIVG